MTPPSGVLPAEIAPVRERSVAGDGQRATLRGGARHDPLLPDVGDDSGRRGEVGILMQDRQAMVQRGSYDQVIRH